MATQTDKLEENGYDLESYDILLIDDDAYYDSLVGVTDDSRAVYDMDIMVEEYSKHYNCTPEEALEYIEYNIIRALPYYHNSAPVIFNRLY